MGNDLPPNPTLARAASNGDLVAGLATVSPPAPFVGELGQPADDAAQELSSGLLRAAGVPPAGIPRVTINGKRIGTTAQVATAIPASPTPGVAMMPQGSGFMRVGGQGVTLERGLANVTPTSVMANMGGTQSFVRVQGPPADEQAGMPDSLMEEIRAGLPPRGSYDDPSALSQMLSGCSMARHLDMAPGEHEVLVGDPVNVVTGAVISEQTDYEQPLPSLRFRRRYDSRRSDRTSALGYGWTFELDQQIYIEPGRVVLRDGDGREKEFSTVHLAGQVSRPGDTLKDSTGRYRLRCVSALQWELSDDTTTRHFAPASGAAPDELERGVSRLTRVAQPRLGTVTECTYEEGRLCEVRVDDRVVLRFEHGSDGLLRRLFSASGGGELMQAKYEYSAAGDLVAVSDPTGKKRLYEYVDHLLVSETSRDGGSFHYTYEGMGARARCTRTWGDGGYLSRSLEYDPQAGVTTVTDSLEQQTTYHYNGAGLVTRIVGPGGDRRSLRYDSRLRLTAVDYADGTSETASYDDDGNLVRRTERDGSTYTMKYSGGRLVEGIDAQGGRWGFAFDEGGRLRRLEDPSGHTTRVDFDARGGMCRVTEATGNQIFMRVNALGQVVEMPWPGHGRVGYAYDDRGRLSAARDSEDRRSRWHYDAQGRLVDRDGFTHRTHWEHSAEGRLVRVNHGQQRTDVERDAHGLVRGVKAKGQEVRYVMDTEGRLMRAQGGEADELLKLERTPTGLVEAWESAEEGRCEVQRQPLSERITGLELPEGAVAIEWNSQGRIGRLRFDQGPTCTYEYRPDGMLLQASHERITCAFDRGPRGDIRSQQWGDVTIEDLHPDHRGRRCGLKMGDGLRVSYLRNRQGSIEDVAVTTGAEIEAGAELRERGEVRGVTTQTHKSRHFDPLWRPMSARGPEHLVWDETRCIVQDGEPRVHHPDDGHLMFVVGEQGTVQAVADDAPSEPPPPPAMIDRVHGAAFPAISDPATAEDALPTPSKLLREVLGYRAWNPEVRPVPGTAPWNPDEWEPRVDSPEPDIGALDAKTLLAALGSPLPRSALAI